MTERYARGAVAGIDDRREVDSGEFRLPPGDVVQHREATDADGQLFGVGFHQQPVHHCFAAVVQHVEDRFRPVHPAVEVGARLAVERQVEHLADSGLRLQQVELRIDAVVDDVAADRQPHRRFEGIAAFGDELPQFG